MTAYMIQLGSEPGTPAADLTVCLFHVEQHQPGVELLLNTRPVVLDIPDMLGGIQVDPSAVLLNNRYPGYFYVHIFFCF